MNPVLLDLPTGLEEQDKEETGDLSEEEEGEEEGAIVPDPSDVKEAEPKLLKVRLNMGCKEVRAAFFKSTHCVCYQVCLSYPL